MALLLCYMVVGTWAETWPSSGQLLAYTGGDGGSGWWMEEGQSLLTLFHSLLFVHFPGCQTSTQQNRVGVGSNQEIEWGLFLEKEFQGNEDQKGLMSGWLSPQAHFPGMKNGSWPFHLAGTVFVWAALLVDIYVVSDVQNEQFRSQIVEQYFHYSNTLKSKDSPK